MANPFATPAVITVYGKDGTKTRRPVGIPGAACHAATRPYEAREIAGQTRKVATPEAGEAAAVAAEERLKTGG